MANRGRRGSIPPSSGATGSRSSLAVDNKEDGEPSEVEESDKPAPDMRGLQEILRAYSSSLTLDWLLQLVSDEIDFGVAHNANGFLIDLMPNMRHLLKCETLIKDCWDEMEKLEEKYPVLFAIDLAMPQVSLSITKLYDPETDKNHLHVIYPLLRTYITRNVGRRQILLPWTTGRQTEPYFKHAFFAKKPGMRRHYELVPA